MKKKNPFSWFLPKLATVLFSLTIMSANPCNPEKMLVDFAGALDDYVFIKSFPIETSKSADKAEYSYVLSRGITYRIVVCDSKEDGKRMIVNLLDRNKKMIATNFLKANKKFYPSINYICSATGVYYVEAFFEGEKSSCGLNIIGFKK